MVENPVVSNNASKSDVHNHKFRDEDPSKFKGNAIFIIQGFKNRGSHKERNTDDIDAVRSILSLQGYWTHRARDVQAPRISIKRHKKRNSSKRYEVWVKQVFFKHSRPDAEHSNKKYALKLDGS